MGCGIILVFFFRRLNKAVVMFMIRALIGFWDTLIHYNTFLKMKTVMNGTGIDSSVETLNPKAYTVYTLNPAP